MKLDFKRIQYFLKVAETLNFSRAAKELYISTQALNKTIQMLEEDLNIPLFECTTRCVKLTEYGEELQKKFRRVDDEYNYACLKMDEYISRKKKTIRIGFFQAIPKKEIINPIILYLKSLDSELHIEAIAGELDEINHWIKSGFTDLNITNIHQYESWNGWETVTFLESPALIAVSLYHPWVIKDTITKQDLDQMPFLVIKRERDINMDEYFSLTKGRELHFVSNFNSLLTNLNSENYFAIMPKLFENMNWLSLKYFDLPKEHRFNFSLVAIYSPNSKFYNYFDPLKSFAEEQVIKL